MKTSDAVALFNDAYAAYEDAQMKLELAFSGFRKLGDFIGAHEHLRSMPQCPIKVFLFHEIIIAETKKGR